MKIDEHGIVFSTGRRLYAHGGVIGLTPLHDGEFLGGDPTEGWDGGLDVEKLTPAERRELADAMVLAWTRWGAGG